MHYYNFHIGDYASHTRHLSPIEDIAYRRNQYVPDRLDVKRKILAVANTNSRKWSDSQRQELLRLAHMRIWTMKKKLTTAKLLPEQL